MIAFKIAWRNLWRHHGRSFAMGSIIFFGSFLLSIGNGVISGMERGLTINITKLFTGDIVVISKEQQNKAVLFGTGGKPLKVISNFATVRKLLMKESSINKFLPATAGTVMALTSESDMGQLMVLGVDIQQYRKMFPDSFTVTEGQTPGTGQKGMLVSETARKYVYDFMNIWLLPEGIKANQKRLPGSNSDIRRELVLMGVNTDNSMVDIREPVSGIIRYKALNQVWGNYSIMDLESFREAYDYTTSANSQIQLSDEEQQLMASENLDRYFDADNMVACSRIAKNNITKQDIQTKTQTETKSSNLDSGAYNLIFIKLKSGCKQIEAVNRLNQLFIKDRLNVKAISWKSAVGSIGSMGDMYKGLLHIFINLLFFVAGIVIMNSLIMTAMERVAEFGMMRAVGAQKSFLQKMFFYETGTLFLYFGGLGIVAGMVVIYLINVANITTVNEVLQIVYGGNKLTPLITAKDLFLALIEVGMTACFAVLYPLRVVRKITPLDAIARD